MGISELTYGDCIIKREGKYGQNCGENQYFKGQEVEKNLVCRKKEPEKTRENALK